MKNIIIFLVCSINGFVTMESEKKPNFVVTKIKRYSKDRTPEQIQLKKEQYKEGYNRFTEKTLDLIKDFHNNKLFCDFYDKISKNKFFNDVLQVHKSIKGRNNYYIKEKIKNIQSLYEVVIDLYNSMKSIDKYNFIKIIKHLHRINFDQLEKIQAKEKKFFLKSYQLMEEIYVC